MTHCHPVKATPCGCNVTHRHPYHATPCGCYVAHRHPVEVTPCGCNMCPVGEGRHTFRCVDINADAPSAHGAQSGQHHVPQLRVVVNDQPVVPVQTVTSALNHMGTEKGKRHIKLFAMHSKYFLKYTITRSIKKMQSYSYTCYQL